MSRIISIEIGLQQTKICEMQAMHNPGRNTMTRCIRFDTPVNTIEDGYVRDKETYGNCLKEQLKNNHFTCNKVIFTIASTKIYTKEILIPYVKTNKIRNVIETNITEYLPFDISDYILSYSVLEKFKVGKLSKLRVLLLAMPESLAKNYYSLAEMLGLEIYALDYSGNSVYQKLKKVHDKGTNVYIQMNEQTTLISIICNQVLMMQRTIAYGTNSIVQAVIDSGYQAVDSEQIALELLHELNIFQEMSKSAYEEIAITEDNDKFQMIDAVSEAFSYLVGSIGRVLDYYTNQESSKSIDQIYLLGHGTEIQGLSDYIHAELGVNIQILERLESIKNRKAAEDYTAHPNEYISCIGALVKPIGFQPKTITAKNEKKANLFVTAGIVGLCAIASILVYIDGEVKVRDAKKNLKEAKSEYAELPESMNEKANYDALEQQAVEALGVSALTVNHNDGLYQLMETLEEQLPTLVEVESLQADNMGIALNVSVVSKEAAANLILKLEGMGIFSEVTTSALGDSADESGIDSVKLSLNCTYRTILDVIGTK